MDMINEKVSVMPTERDFCVLKSLYDNVVMSFPQIARMHFQNRSKPTVINRLTKLEMAGLITRLKVPRLQVTGATNVISVVYQISRNGIRALQKRLPGIELRPEPVRLRPYSVDHDLLLVDVLAALKIQRPALEFLNGELWLADGRHNGLRPDAILVNPNGLGKSAMELELTAKSEKRYRELILKYRLSNDFAKVIYVTSHRQIETKIKAILGPGGSDERFEFLKLEDVLGVNSVSPNNKSLHQIDERKGREI